MATQPAELTRGEWAALLGMEVPANWPTAWTGVQSDSRRVRPGDLFVAIEGSAADGHEYVTDALRRGATGILCSRPVAVPPTVRCLQVPDPRAALSRVSRALHGFPDQQLHLVGVTGTNGKTTVTVLLRQLLEGCGFSTGLLGTVSHVMGGREIPARRTTPGPPELHHYLRGMVTAGLTDCVMEISSHALDQQRVLDLQVETAVFTNLSRDHLDYHGDMETYFVAKARLFDFPGLRHRIVGEDDWSRRLADRHGGEVLRCGLGADCDLRAEILEADLRGTRARLWSPWGEGELLLPLPGPHNLRNALQALAAAALRGGCWQQLLELARQLRPAPGRLEAIPGGRGQILVDYAHTPDALRHVCALLRELTSGRLIVLFGCGGDRDRGKRPLMVQAAAAASDEMIFTADNPRGEDPDLIFREMEAGLRPGDVWVRIDDRRAAIAHGIGKLKEGDCLLIAGKGHEQVQEIGALRIPFDDREVARACLAGQDQTEIPEGCHAAI